MREDISSCTNRDFIVPLRASVCLAGGHRAGGAYPMVPDRTSAFGVYRSVASSGLSVTVSLRVGVAGFALHMFLFLIRYKFDHE
jgi:hypothetical protein